MPDAATNVPELSIRQYDALLAVSMCVRDVSAAQAVVAELIQLGLAERTSTGVAATPAGEEYIRSETLYAIREGGNWLNPFDGADSYLAGRGPTTPKR